MNRSCLLAGRPLLALTCLALVCLGGGCGEEDPAAGRSESPGAGRTAPPPGEALVPLSGNDPAQVVGASSFNRFRLLFHESGSAGVALPTARGLDVAELLREARAHLAEGRYRSAGAAFRAAAGRARNAGALGLEAGLLRQAVACYELLGERLEVLELLKRFVAVERGAGRTVEAARVQTDLGCVYGQLGNYARALDNLGAALADLPPKARYRPFVLAFMGLVHLRRSEYGAALDALEQADELLGRSEDEDAKAYVRSLLGNVYENVGDYPRAKELYEEARALRGDELSVHVGDVLGNLGSVHANLGETDAAVTYYERARAIFEKLEDRAGVANALFSIGRIRKVQGGYRTALDVFRRALRLQERDSPQAARTLGAMAETWLAMGRPDEALEEVRNAFETEAAGTTRTVEVELLVVQALADLRKGQPERAIVTIRRALDRLMEVTAGLADEHVVGVREHRSWVFDTAIAVALKTGRVDLAAEFLEHSRAGALLEGLGGREARRGLSPELEEAEALASQRLAEANRRYQQARAERRLKAMRAADADVQGARRAYRTVEQRIQREAKRLASVFHPVPDSLADMRAGLREGEVLVLYALLPFQAHALIVTRRDARVAWLGNTRDIREACETLRVDAKEPAAAVEARLAALARMVVTPLRLPEGMRRLLISPDGPLCYVPFPLLFGAEPVQVACLPSGTTLGLLAEERERVGRGTLALGDPEYVIEHQGKSLQVYARGVPLEPLPATRKEVQAITSEQDVRLLGSYATVRNLAETAASRARWSVIHLACHGLIDPRTPTLSALALTADPGDDGFLTALEVYGMHLPADLVVLSGCNTGRGRFVKGEGLVGLVRAFMCAGSPRIVVSLWKVDDEATQVLMTRFHRLWRDGGHPTAQALQQAQRDMRREPRWKHPRYWGAWVLWGLPD